MTLTQEEFNDLTNNQGKLMLMKGFLLTSYSDEKSNDLIDICLEIQCDIKELGDTLIFADVSKLSQNRSNKTILFDLSTTFRLKSIEKLDTLWLIRLIRKKYINDIRRQINELSIPIMFGKLLFDRCEWNPSENYLKCLLNDSISEDQVWIEHSIGQALYCKGEWNEARMYYDRSYDRMMKSNPIFTIILKTNL